MVSFTQQASKFDSKQQDMTAWSTAVLIMCKANDTLKIMNLTEWLYKWCFLVCSMWNIVMRGEHLKTYTVLFAEDNLIKTAIQKTSYQEGETRVMSQEMLHQTLS